MKRLSFRERQQQVREQAIVDAAFELLTTKGYTAMTMDDVAALVGISKATLYQHFRSKEELTVSVAVSILKRSEEYLGSLDPELPAMERLQRVMRGLIELRCRAEQRSEKRYPGGLYATLKPIVSGHPRFLAQYRRMVSAFSGLVDTAKAEGDIKAQIPTRIMVQAMLGLTRDFDYAEMVASMEVSPERLSESLAAIFLEGVRGGRTD